MKAERPLFIQPGTKETISIDDARRIAVRAQWLPADRSHTPSVQEVAERLGCIQLDAMQAVRRSHELVLLARGVPIQELNQVHTVSAGLFETWGHAHSLLPRSMWPLLRWRREFIAQRGLSGPQLDRQVAKEVLKRIEVEGPSTLNDLGKSVGRGWDRTSPIKVACEWLLSTGELAVIDRDPNWKRIYRTPQQAGFPDHESITSEESIRRTILISLSALGIARIKDIQDYFRIPRDLEIAAVAESAGYVRVRVEKTKSDWFVHPTTLEHLKDNDPQDGQFVTVLSPFDSLVWTRSRQNDLFGKNYVLEAYKPAKAREFGYFSMPILLNDRLIGRVAARMTSGTVAIENFECDDDIHPAEIRAAVVANFRRWNAPILDENQCEARKES